jgi:hypothetical protein
MDSSDNDVWGSLSGLVDTVASGTVNVINAEADLTRAAPSGTTAKPNTTNPFPGFASFFPQNDVKTGQGSTPTAPSANYLLGFRMPSGSQWPLIILGILGVIFALKFIRR